MTLSDGRTLAFDSYGAPDGTPVIFSHGFSDSHVLRHPDDGLTASLGVRWIAADQPGVGGLEPEEAPQDGGLGRRHGRAGGPSRSAALQRRRSFGGWAARARGCHPYARSRRQGRLGVAGGALRRAGRHEHARDEGSADDRQVAAPPSPAPVGDALRCEEDHEGHPLLRGGDGRRAARRGSNDAAQSGAAGPLRGEFSSRLHPGGGRHLRDDDGFVGLGLLAPRHQPAGRALLRHRRRHHLAQDAAPSVRGAQALHVARLGGCGALRARRSGALDRSS